MKPPGHDWNEASLSEEPAVELLRHLGYGSVGISKNPASWDIPLDQIGSAREGLSVVVVDVLAGAPLSSSTFQVIVAGQVVCNFSANPDNTDQINGKCPLSGTPSTLQLSIVGYHPASGVLVNLQEPTPTQHQTVCGG